MVDQEFDPLAEKARADAVLERTAQQLRHILHEMVARLDPFPPFPGAFFTYAIEVEPAAAATPDRGCIVVAPDGEIYELLMKMSPDDEYADPVAMRDEELKKLDLHPRDYIVYAYNAISRIAEMLLGQEEEP